MLPAQISDIYRRWKQKRNGQRVGLPFILKCFEADAKGEPYGEVGDEQVMTPTLLQEIVPGMKQSQAERVLRKANDKFQLDEENKRDVDEDDIFLETTKIWNAQRAVGESMKQRTMISE